MHIFYTLTSPPLSKRGDVIMWIDYLIEKLLAVIKAHFKP
jgi:hypothetical protein